MIEAIATIAVAALALILGLLCEYQEHPEDFHGMDGNRMKAQLAYIDAHDNIWIYDPLTDVYMLSGKLTDASPIVRQSEVPNAPNVWIDAYPDPPFGYGIE